MKTQIDTVREIFEGLGEGILVSTGEIRKITGFPLPSIRRITSNLVNTGSVQRIDIGLFAKTSSSTERKIIDSGKSNLHRKFIGTRRYGGDTRQFFALTFEDNDIDREEELVGELVQFLNANYVESAGDTGYEDIEVTSQSIDTRFIYPSIQVEEL